MRTLLALIMLATSSLSAAALAVDGTNSDAISMSTEVVCTSPAYIQLYLDELMLGTFQNPLVAVEITNARTGDPKACAIRTVYHTDLVIVTRVATPHGIYAIYKTNIIAEIDGDVTMPTFGKDRYMYIYRADIPRK